MPPARITFLLHIKPNKSDSAGDNAYGECSRTAIILRQTMVRETSIWSSETFVATPRRAAQLYIDVGVISYVSRKYQPRSAIVQRLYLQHVPRGADSPWLDVIAFIIPANTFVPCLNPRDRCAN